MSTMSFTSAQIPCCICGTMIYPNAANQCTTCLSQDFNLQDYIQRPPSSSTGNHSNKDDRPPIIIHQCRNCRRFQRTEKCWEYADHESSQLMSICLKHIPALQQNYHSTSSSTSTSSSSSSMIPSSASHHSTAAAIGPLRLIDAQWIWTEPHCMRYKIRCTIQTEIHQVRVQQRVVVLLHCVFKMCVDCTREFNHRTWQSVVQVRQRVSAEQQQSSSTSTSATVAKTSSSSSAHMTTMNGLTILEQTLAKHKEIRKHVLKIDPVPNQGGFDFYFISIPHAHTFVSFLQRIIPMRVRTSKKLVSTDAHSKNTAHMKHTMVCDMVPFQVHDLMVIHKSTSKCKLAGQLVLVTKLASVIHLVNAAPGISTIHKKNSNTAATITNNGTTQNNYSIMDDCVMELSAESYYKQEKQYRVLQANHRLVRFVVLDVELLETNSMNYNHDNSNSMTPSISSTGSSVVTGQKQKQQQPYALADVLVARESDMGCNDRTYTTVTHLGLQIEAGDIVLGYDLTSLSIYLDDDDMKDTFNHNFTMPDIVLVKKAPPLATAAGDNKSDAMSRSSKKSSRNNNKEKRQRRRQNDGKRARELEERAKRMGFIEGGDLDQPDDEQNKPPDDTDTFVKQQNFVEKEEDDDNVIRSTVTSRSNHYTEEEDSILYDTDIVNEVLALEREFETLDLQHLNEEHEEHKDDDDDIADDNLDSYEFEENDRDFAIR